MTRRFLLVLLAGVGACAAPSQLPLRRRLAQLHTAQQRAASYWAGSAAYARKLAYARHVFPAVAAGDTLFVLERVPATGGTVFETYVWTSRRQTVTKYEQAPAFRRADFPYHRFDDPLRAVTEQRDSVRVGQRRSPLDAPLVYISRLYRRGVDTYSFSDVTPVFYLGK
jgi:hypothetical protein